MKRSNIYKDKDYKLYKYFYFKESCNMCLISLLKSESAINSFELAEGLKDSHKEALQALRESLTPETMCIDPVKKIQTAKTAKKFLNPQTAKKMDKQLNLFTGKHASDNILERLSQNSKKIKTAKEITKSISILAEIDRLKKEHGFI